MTRDRERRVMLVNRRPPHGTVHAWEALEAALMAGAFGGEVTVAFVDDGVWQLKRGQDTAAIGTRGFSRAFGALAEHGVRRLVVEASSLERRGLTPADLVVPVEVLDSDALGRLMDAQDALLSC